MTDAEKKIAKSLKDSLHEATKELISYGEIPFGDRYLYKTNIRFLKNKIASLKSDLKFLGVNI